MSTQHKDQIVLVVDIDGTICTNTEGSYEDAAPNEQAIENLNRLYAGGLRIVLFTARGSTTGIDWRELTEAQLLRWGVLYHELHFGKPFGHFYIDDKAVLAKDLESGSLLSTLSNVLSN